MPLAFTLVLGLSLFTSGCVGDLDLASLQFHLMHVLLSWVPVWIGGTVVVAVVTSHPVGWWDPHHHRHRLMFWQECDGREFLQSVLTQCVCVCVSFRVSLQLI